jgi:predicted AAA+ superfamily ATPase
MIAGVLHDRLVDTLNYFRAVALLGPRQVGKTSLALEISNTCNARTYSIYCTAKHRSQTFIPVCGLFL